MDEPTRHTSENANWNERLLEMVTMIALVLFTCSVIPIQTPAGLAILCLWTGLGHTVLFCFGLYPRHTLKAVPRGVLAHVLGLVWPLWVLRYRHRIQL